MNNTMDEAFDQTLGGTSHEPSDAPPREALNETSKHSSRKMLNETPRRSPADAPDTSPGDSVDKRLGTTPGKSFNKMFVRRDKDALLRRLRRIEGQVRGLQRMVDEDKYCVDILVQIAAVRSALERVGLMLLKDHTKGCVARAIERNEGDEAVDELMDVISKFLR